MKKVLAILLAALMVMALVPTVAFADSAFTLSLPGAKAVYRFAGGVSTKSKEEAELELTFFESDYVPEEIPEWAADEDVTNWSEYYELAEESLEGSSKFTGSDGSFNFSSSTPLVYWVLIVLTDSDVFAPGAAYTAYYGTSDGAGGAITLDPTPIDSGKLNTDAPAAPSGSANIKGVIDAADFAYEMIIPSDTTLTEDDHTDVLLGDDGIVTIEVTKHACDTIKVFYTVDLDGATLTDGETDITTTYGFSEDGTNFDDLAEETKYTVYTAGAVKNTYVNVSADNDEWDAAPVGEYTAVVVFNFDTAPLCKCGVDLTEYTQLLKIEHINGNNVDAFLFEHDGEHFGLFSNSPFNFPISIYDDEGFIASMINGSFNEGEYYHASDDDCKKCTSPENLDVYDDVIFSVETVGITYFSVPAGSTYEITENNILIYPSSKYEPDALRKNNVDAYKLATVTLNGKPLATSATGTINNGDAFYFTVVSAE